MRDPAADLISDLQVLDAGAAQIGMLIVGINHGCTLQIDSSFSSNGTLGEKRNWQA